MVQGVRKEDGHLVDTNPATGAVIEKIKCTPEAEITAIVAHAQAAQASWAAVPLAERVALLKKAVASLGPRSDALAALITEEMGKVLSEAAEEVSGAVDKDEYLDLIADATGHEDADTELRADAARAALRHRASGPVAMVATMLAELRGAQELRTRVVLVVLDALVNGAAPCTVHTFGDDGGCTPATLGAVVDNADAATAVLVVKRGDAAFARSLDRVYLTTTEAAGAADPLQTA